MEVTSLSPLRAGSVLWRPRPDRWTLTVVCKATYALAPGESALAAEQEGVNQRDGFWDDDPRRSVRAPSDLAPFKPRADVSLVGNAYAPRSEVVRALTARLIVGEVEKAVEVHCPRVITREGELREGARWSTMPLRYEYAAGGLETWNPVGVGPSAPADQYGQRPLPNLQPPGLRAAQWSDIFVPTGFGPISPRWRLRREKLGRRADGWSDEGWTQIALDDDFDGEFFQTAPPDQQVDALRDDERIVLEYLNADHPSLATKLPGVHPHAFVEIPGAAARDLLMTADTLWIDTDRAICTLTWRGQVAVDGPTQAGRVIIALEAAGQHLTWTDVGGDGAVESSSSESPPPAPRRVVKPTLPFLPSDRSPPEASPEAALEAAPLAPGEATGAESDADPPLTPRTSGPRRTLQMIAEPPPPGTLPMRLGWPAPVEAPVIATARANTQVSVVLDASQVRPAAPERALELVWFSPTLPARARKIVGWSQAQPEGAEPSPERDVARVLTRAALSTDDLESALFESVGESGALSPPLLVLAGVLSFAFDEVEALRAVIAAATPAARADPHLAGLLDAALEMAKTELQGSPEVAADLGAGLRAAWAQANKALPATHLDQQVERGLLARRCYQRRELLGKKWVRALFQPPGAAGATPAYLPAAVASRLPLFLRFPARLVAEVLPRQEQCEASPVCLRVVALGRELTREG
jgi:hypothetical protein